MATAIYCCAASLDGYIADADDGLDWLVGEEGSSAEDSAEPDPTAEGGSLAEFYEEVGALVSGSATYEWVLGHLAKGDGEWPYPNKPWWVLSSRELRRQEGEGVDLRFANGPVAELYDEMAASAGDGVLWVLGGGGLASQFAAANLLDEVYVTVVPAVLGAGKPLFERPLARDSLHLTGTRALGNGMVELRYAVRR